MKIYFKLTIIFIVCIIAFSFSGCNPDDIMYSLLVDEYKVPEENLVITDSPQVDSYMYSGKVRIDLDPSFHSFDIMTEDDYVNLLTGYFKKFTYHEGKLIILFEDIYYVFDIDNYRIPKSEDALEYDLKEYTESDFINEYPQHETFTWRYCGEHRGAVIALDEETAEYYWMSDETKFENFTSLPLPTSAKLKDFVDTRELANDGDYYISATIELQNDKETAEFIQTIKQSWIAPSIKDYKDYDEINKIAFSKNLVPYSDDYYYFYVNDYYDNKEYDFYYGDFFTLIAFDEESKTIYLYSSDI